MFKSLKTKLIKHLFVISMMLLPAVLCYAGEPGNEGSSFVLEQSTGAGGAVFVPGDAVSISTLPDSASFLNNVFPIDDRGYVEFPIYGKVKISHMSKDQLVAYIKDQFRNELLYDNLQVKPMVRISVLGGVPTPGFYYFDPDRSLWEVLQEVGGTQDEDGLKQMRWKRSGKAVEENLIPSLQSGISLKRMGFRSGDQIWVRTPNKPGTLEKVRGYLNLVTAVASAATLIITYQLTLRNQ